ncbi:MAG: ORF6N domain-containing protein [Candidatus Omnitrophica bacterium]|nr:ORF6N domain-containing protein [Candidatus Omnitrophota bacterium]
MTQVILTDRIGRQIYLIRGHKVMLDSDLAELYGIPTFRLNEQVRRNTKRFPPDFMFQLTARESKSLRSQFAISKKRGRGGRRYAPLVFTEQGVAMLSSVLNSERAIQVNIVIMRVFVKLKQVFATHRPLARKLAELEHRLEGHDQEIRSLFEAIRELMKPPETPRRRIGFHHWKGARS